MKKFMLTIIAVLLSITCCLSACLGEVVEEIDKNKTQIYLGLYDGGVGTSWMNRLVKEWNANNAEYEVIVVPKKLGHTDVINNIKASEGSATAPSIYFSVAGAQYKNSINQNLFEDLSDLLDVKPDGESGLTIREKLSVTPTSFSDWSKMAKNDFTNSGMYMLPWNECVSGFIYNHDDFVEFGWLNFADASDEPALTEQGIVFDYNTDGKLCFVSATGKTNYSQGDVILKAGKDGKFGTYDDGQPQTVAEWENMLDLIELGGFGTLKGDTSPKSYNTKQFLWTGQFASQYIERLNPSLMAQFGGIQAVKDFYDRDSDGVEYEMNDGSFSAFTIDEGYKSYNMKIIGQTVDFVDKYLTGNSVHPDVLKSKSHGDAQSKFLMGYRLDGTDPSYIAMIYEGSWWENEARTTFNTIANTRPARGYGMCDYRYMCLPYFDGGISHGSAFTIMEQSSVIVPKCSDAAKLAQIKDFIAFSLKDESLRKFTVETGVIRPYVYDLTEEDRSQMTKFACNSWDLYKDSENIVFVRDEMYQCQPVSYATSSFYALPAVAKKSDGKFTQIYSYLLGALQTAGIDADNLKEGIAQYYSATLWNSVVAQAKAAGFYA